MFHPHCPRCDIALQAVKSSTINYLSCRLCQGQLISLFNLDKVIKGNLVINLWNSAHRANTDKTTYCPKCIKPLNNFNYPSDTADPHVEVDVCKPCRVIWLDAGEAKALKQTNKPQAVQQPKVSTPAKNTSSHFTRTKPPGGLKTLVTLMGFPIEAVADEHKAPPTLTWLLLTMSIVASVMAFGDKALFGMLEYSTLKPFSQQILNSFSVFFVHGGWFHLIGNMYFLWVFGDNVEADLGKVKYLLLVVLATMVGTFAFAFFDKSGLPLVGASGGISGLLGYYLLRFPKRKFVVSYFLNWFYMSSLAFGALYLAKDVLGLVFGSGSNVAHISHLSGVFIGVLFYFWQKPKELKTPTEPKQQLT